MAKKKAGARRKRVLYSQAMGKKVCERLAEGESLQAIDRDPKMPSRRSVQYWRRTHPEFERLYLMAREDQAELYVDDIPVIIEDLISKIEAGNLTKQQIAGLCKAVDLKVATMLKIASFNYHDRFGDRRRIDHGAHTSLTDVLQSINQEGADCGPGPARSRKGDKGKAK